MYFIRLHLSMTECVTAEKRNSKKEKKPSIHFTILLLLMFSVLVYLSQREDDQYFVNLYYSLFFGCCGKRHKSFSWTYYVRSNVVYLKNCVLFGVLLCSHSGGGGAKSVFSLCLLSWPCLINCLHYIPFLWSSFVIVMCAIVSVSLYGDWY